MAATEIPQMLQFIPLYILAIALLLVVAYWVPHWLMRWRAGRCAPDVSDLMDDQRLRGARLWVYFFGPGCGHCRGITPVMEDLAAHGHDVLKVDVSQSPELAKRFEVRLIPAVLEIRQGRITQVLVGPNLRKTLAALRSALTDGPPPGQGPYANAHS